MTMSIPMNPRPPQITTHQESAITRPFSPENSTPSRGGNAKVHLISTIAFAILFTLGIGACIITAAIVAEPLFLIGALACTFLTLTLSSVACCSCPGPSDGYRRRNAFERLSPSLVFASPGIRQPNIYRGNSHVVVGKPTDVVWNPNGFPGRLHVVPGQRW